MNIAVIPACEQTPRRGESVSRDPFWAFAEFRAWNNSSGICGPPQLGSGAGESWPERPAAAIACHGMPAPEGGAAAAAAEKEEAEGGQQPWR